MFNGHRGKKLAIRLSSLFALFALTVNASAFENEVSAVSAKIEELTSKIQRSAPVPPERGRKSKIAIIELENLSAGARRNNIGKIVSELLTTHLVRSGSFAVVEREQLNNVLEELRLNQTGLVDADSAKAVGKMLAADAIVCGSISEVGTFFDVNVRLIDVESASIITAAVTEIRQRDFLHSLEGSGPAEDLTRRIQKNLDTLDTAVHLYSSMHSGTQSNYVVVLPKQLDDLVPEYLDRIPDPIEGEWSYDATTGKVHNTAFPSLIPTQVHIKQQPFLTKAKEMSLMPALQNIRVALRMYYSEIGRWPDRLDDLVPEFIPQLPDARDGTWKYEPKEGKVWHSLFKPKN